MTATAPVPVAAPQRIRYGALVVVMMMSFLLVTAEFLPNGLLTEMADGLGITPGQAGQTVTVTALVGFFAAPTVGLVFPKLDRRTLLVWLAVAAALSNLIVAIAPNLLIVLLARFLLGAALSGFWAMSISVAVRLAGPGNLGRGVMFTSAGTSLATVAGVPVGVMLSAAMDWQSVFVVAAIATGILAILLRFVLPSVPAAPASSIRDLFDTVRRPGVGPGLAGHVLVVVGNTLAYTYIRLALERMPDVDGGTIVILLALFGVGGLVGNLVIGSIIDRTFGVLAVVTPVIIGTAVLATILLSSSVFAVGAAVFVWGFFFASWLIIVNTWVGHRMPDRLEAGGSLIVVGFQGAIMVAAGVGGLLVDSLGVEATYVLGTALLLAGAGLFGASNRVRSRD